MLIRRWWKWHLGVERRHIKHLEQEVQYWRGLHQHERQRAELAIDQCRAHHQTLPPVTQPLRPDREQELAKELREMLQQPEMNLIGAPDAP